LHNFKKRLHNSAGPCNALTDGDRDPNKLKDGETKPSSKVIDTDTAERISDTKSGIASKKKKDREKDQDASTADRKKPHDSGWKETEVLEPGASTKVSEDRHPSSDEISRTRGMQRELELKVSFRL